MDQSSFTEAERREWSTLISKISAAKTTLELEEKARQVKDESTHLRVLETSLKSNQQRLQKLEEEFEPSIAGLKRQIEELQRALENRHRSFEQQKERYLETIENKKKDIQKEKDRLVNCKSKSHLAAELVLEKLLESKRKFLQFKGLQDPAPPIAPQPPPVPKKTNPLNGGDTESDSEEDDEDIPPPPPLEEEEDDDIPPPPTTAPPSQKKGGGGVPIFSESISQPPTRRVIRGQGRKELPPEESDSEEDRVTAMRAFFSPDSFRAAPRHFAPQMEVDRPRVIQNTKKQPKRVVAY